MLSILKRKGNYKKILKYEDKKKKSSLKEDEQGSILPMIAIILILTISLGAVNFALVVMYRDRAVVRNALDAGTTSSLAAVAVEKKKAIFYGEYSYCSDGYWATGTDSEGNSYSYWVCTETTWVNTESNIKNYIQLNIGEANSVAKNYFDRNMTFNNLDYSIKSWNFSVEYDDERIYTVEKNRYINRPESSSVVNNVTNPPKWWFSDFDGANTGLWTPPPGWTSDIYEEREIIFPRWVEVKAKVVVELPVPFGSLVGRTTYKASFDVTSYKELIYAIP